MLTTYLPNKRLLGTCFLTNGDSNNINKRVCYTLNGEEFM